MNLSSLLSCLKSDLHVSISTNLHQNFFWLHPSQQKFTIFRVWLEKICLPKTKGNREATMFKKLVSPAYSFSLRVWLFLYVILFLLQSAPQPVLQDGWTRDRHSNEFEFNQECLFVSETTSDPQTDHKRLVSSENMTNLKETPAKPPSRPPSARRTNSLKLAVKLNKIQCLLGHTIHHPSPSISASDPAGFSRTVPSTLGHSIANKCQAAIFIHHSWMLTMPYTSLLSVPCNAHLHLLFSTLSGSFSSFARATCLLSASHPYLALAERYPPALRSNPNERDSSISRTRRIKNAQCFFYGAITL